MANLLSMKITIHLTSSSKFHWPTRNKNLCQRSVDRSATKTTKEFEIYKQSLLQFKLYKIVTYVNTCPPQPAIAVKILGPKSRAGFRAKPVLKPNVAPIVKTTSPITRGITPLGGALFFSSVMAHIHPTRSIVPNTCNGGFTNILINLLQ